MFVYAIADPVIFYKETPGGQRSHRRNGGNARGILFPSSGHSLPELINSTGQLVLDPKYMISKSTQPFSTESMLLLTQTDLVGGHVFTIRDLATQTLPYPFTINMGHNPLRLDAREG